jgi:chemotaxis protein CheD
VADEKIMIIAGGGVVCRAPAVFSSVGLGSCVVVTFYDPRRCIGGLAHIMLPGSRRETVVPVIVLTGKGSYCLNDQAKAGTNTSLDEVYHYADTAIVALLREMINMGVSLSNIVAKIAGGAKMFADGEHYEKSIGGRNVKAIKQLLKKEKIPVIGEDTGGNYGRNVDFYLDSGRVVISTIGGMNREI